MGRLLAFALAVGLSALAGCGRSNPVLGGWELDRQETALGAVLAVQRPVSRRSPSTATAPRAARPRSPANGSLEEGRVRLVREDGRGDHAIEVLSEDQIRVELPIGVTAYYRRKP